MTDVALPMTEAEARRITERILTSRAGLVSRIAADPTRVFPGIRRREPRLLTGWVYFIQAERSAAIKIGFATDVSKRIAQLQTGTHEALVLIGLLPGTVRDEKALHRRFCHYRIRSEWFEPSGELLDFIEGSAR